MTVFHPRALLAAGMTLLATAAGAQTTLGNAQMVSVTGHCGRLLVGERDLTAACSTKVVNVAYPDARVSFYFLLSDGTSSASPAWTARTRHPTRTLYTSTRC